MKITQRQVVSLTLGIIVVGDIILELALTILQRWDGAAIAAISALATGALLTAHLRGWKHAASVFLIFSSVLTGSAMNIVLVNGRASVPLTLIFPPVLGLALVGARGIIVSASLSLGIYVVRAILSGYTVDPVLIIAYVLLVLLILVARTVLNTEVQRAEEGPPARGGSAGAHRRTGACPGSRQHRAAGATGRATSPARPGCDA